MAATLTAQIAAKAAVSDPAKELLRDDLSPSAYLNLLAEKALFKDALLFFAHGVPVDVAVQWAVDCVKELKPAQPPAKPSESLPLCEQWLQTRSEDVRRAAGKSAKKALMATPADSVAMAVFFTGKSIAAAGAPGAPAPAGASERMAAGAVRMAVLKSPPEKAAQNYGRALEIGKTLAKGKGVAYFAG